LWAGSTAERQLGCRRVAAARVRTGDSDRAVIRALLHGPSRSGLGAHNVHRSVDALRPGFDQPVPVAFSGLFQLLHGRQQRHHRCGAGDGRSRLLRVGERRSVAVVLVPDGVKHWSLTTLRVKLVKIGTKVLRHAGTWCLRWRRSHPAPPFRNDPSPNQPVMTGAGLTACRRRRQAVKCDETGEDTLSCRQKAIRQAPVSGNRA
jgi:hypothetical protein